MIYFFTKDNWQKQMLKNYQNELTQQSKNQQRDNWQDVTRNWFLQKGKSERTYDITHPITLYIAIWLTFATLITEVKIGSIYDIYKTGKITFTFVVYYPYSLGFI